MSGVLRPGWRHGIGVVVLLTASAAGWWLRSPLPPQPGSTPSASVDAAAAFAASRQLLAHPLVDLDGVPQPWQQWQGKLLVINLWASWCPPCREEMPGFVRLQIAYAARGVQFVGLAVDEPVAVADFLRRVPVNYPILLGDAVLLRLFAGFGNRLGALPYTIILDHDGRLLRAHQGHWREASLAQALDQALQNKPLPAQ